MPEITEETLREWARLADYTDSHGSLDARVALDAAIAEIRRLHAAIAARDGQIGALVAALTEQQCDCTVRSFCEKCRFEELGRKPIPQKDGTYWWTCGRCETPVECKPKDGIECARCAILANLPAAAKERDKRLKAEGAAEAYETEAMAWDAEALGAQVLIDQSAKRTFRRRAEEARERAARLREEAGR